MEDILGLDGNFYNVFKYQVMTRKEYDVIDDNIQFILLRMTYYQF